MFSLEIIFDENSYNWTIVLIQTFFSQLYYIVVKHIYQSLNFGLFLHQVVFVFHIPKFFCSLNSSILAQTFSCLRLPENKR